MGTHLYRLIIPETGKVYAQVKLTFLRSIPIKKVPNKIQSKIATIVDDIQIQKKSNSNVSGLENKVNTMIYKIYELTYDEIIIIDPEFPLSQEEYDNYNIE